MTARVGDEIMIIPQDLHEPVREGQIREVRNDLDGVVYLVQWSDTGHESMLPHGPNVVIKHRHTGGTEAVTGGETPWLSRLRIRWSGVTIETWSNGNRLGMSSLPRGWRKSSPASG